MRSHSRVLLLIVVASVAARLLFCFVIFPRYLAPHSTVGEVYFFDSYRELATELLRSRSFRVAPDAPPAFHRPPGYPLLLTLIAPAAGGASLRLHILHAMLGGLAVLLTAILCRIYGYSPRVQWLAAAGAAFWPFLVWESKVSVPENLLVLLVPAIARQGWTYQQEDRAAAEYVRSIARAGGFEMADSDRSHPPLARWLDQAAKQHLIQHPGQALLKTAVKVPLFWIHQQTARRMIVTALLVVPILALGAIGVTGAPRETWWMAIFVLTINVVSAVVYSDAVPMRYALPLLPLVFFFAAATSVDREPRAG